MFYLQQSYSELHSARVLLLGCQWEFRSGEGTPLLGEKLWGSGRNGEGKSGFPHPVLAGLLS